MSTTKPSSPLDRSAVIDRYFMEHRAKIIDVAAFLDRVERAASATGDPLAGFDDFRLRSLRAAIEVLLDGQSERARRILELLSDPGEAAIERAPMKGATGAWDGFEGGEHRSEADREASP